MALLWLILLLCLEYGRAEQLIAVCSVFCEGSGFRWLVDVSPGFVRRGDGLCMCGDCGVASSKCFHLCLGSAQGMIVPCCSLRMSGGPKPGLSQPVRRGEQVWGDYTGAF